MNSKYSITERVLGLIVLAGLMALLLQGCAYQPIVDRPNTDYHKDLEECRQHANQTGGPGTTAAIGAGIGYALGQVFSRATGNKRFSNELSRGGAVAGAAQGAAQGMENERNVIRNCMLGRGHRILN